MVSVFVLCFGAVLPMFLLYYLLFCSRNCLEKIVLLVFVFLRETAQVVTGHTPTRTLRSCFFFLSVSPATTGFISRFGCASFLSGVLSGCHSGPRAFWRFLDSLGSWGGLRLLAPVLRPFSRTRGGKGASLLLVLVLFFPFLFCGCTPFLEARVGFLAEVVITGRPSPPLGRVIPRGALLARRVGPLHFRDFDGLFWQP